MGNLSLQKRIKSLEISDINKLAPRFIEVTKAGLEECNKSGIDLVLHETLRVQELQAIYFKTGASKAATIYHAYHGYGLAFDGKSKKFNWSVPESYWLDANLILSNKFGLVWGGTFKSIHDTDHWQWQSLRDKWISPTKIMQNLLHNNNIEEVWRLVGAMA